MTRGRTVRHFIQKRAKNSSGLDTAANSILGNQNGKEGYLMGFRNLYHPLRISTLKNPPLWSGSGAAIIKIVQSMACDISKLSAQQQKYIYGIRN